MRTGLRKRFARTSSSGPTGAHSAVRKALGAGFPGEALEAYFYIADFRYAKPVDAHFAEITLCDPGMLGRLPVSADVLRYISTLEDFEGRIIHPEVVAEKTWASQFRIHFRHVEPMAKGNVFMAGDAAHIHSPAGARGMNLGIEDACWLAWLIAEGREEEYSALRNSSRETGAEADLWPDPTGHYEKSAGDCHAQSVSRRRFCVSDLHGVGCFIVSPATTRQGRHGSIGPNKN